MDESSVGGGRKGSSGGDWLSTGRCREATLLNKTWTTARLARPAPKWQILPGKTQFTSAYFRIAHARLRPARSKRFLNGRRVFEWLKLSPLRYYYLPWARFGVLYVSENRSGPVFYGAECTLSTRDLGYPLPMPTSGQLSVLKHEHCQSV